MVDNTLKTAWLPTLAALAAVKSTPRVHLARSNDPMSLCA